MSSQQAVTVNAARPRAIWQRLAKHYPEHLVRWVHGATWTSADVPTGAIHMRPRPSSPHDEEKVRALRKMLRKGKKHRRVVLVDTGKGRLKIADGYHRLKAQTLEGHETHRAVIGHLPVHRHTGPWSHAMHAHKLNR